MKDLRLLPIVLFALASLLLVKALDVLNRGGVKVQGTSVAQAEEANVEDQTFGRALTDLRAKRATTPDPALSGVGGITTVDKRPPADPVITGSAARAPKEEAAPKEEPKKTLLLGQKPITLEEQRKADAAKAAAEAGVTTLPVSTEGDPAAHDAAAPVEGAPAAEHGSTHAESAPASDQGAAFADPAPGAAAPADPAAPQAPAVVEAAPSPSNVSEAPAQAPLAPVEVDAPLDPSASSPSERALLERLQARRQQLDEQGRELDLRENLLTAAEKRIEDRITELKTMESSVGAAQEKKAQDDKTRLKGLIDMYSAMKPKDAARIFDTLDTELLVGVAGAMKPAVMGPIIAAMSPEAASRLTVALAGRAQAPKDVPAGAPVTELPKIEGKPTTGN